jgi:hypothetical protein
MTSDFGSLPLARLYEQQGYIDEALEIYRAMDTSQNEHVLDAVARIEARKEAADDKERAKDPSHDGLNLNSDQVQGCTKEAQMTHLLEVWVRLIVMRKRTDIFRAIRARL